jgi:hypothetical protein
MKSHLEVIQSARESGHEVRQYVGGTFAIIIPGARFATVYHPDGTVRRVRASLIK